MAAHNNYEIFQEAKCDLGLTDIINALNYIDELRAWLPKEHGLHEYYLEITNPLAKFASDCITDKSCPKCGETLFCSDIAEYDYVCTECDENFYECEVK